MISIELLVKSLCSQSQKVLKGNACIMYSNGNFIHLLSKLDFKTVMKDALVSLV